MELYYKINGGSFTKAKCFTHNYASFLNYCLGHTYTNLWCTDHTCVNGNWNKVHSLVASAGTTSIGIVVGKSNVASNYLDFKLVDLIEHGTGLNQLEYGGCIVNDLADSGTYYFIRIERSFANTSGSPIDVNEIGIYSEQHVCFVRDVLPSPETIQDSKTMNVIYEIRVGY